ncbi:MAG: hypothetical protein R3C28_01820 [Pirellulaceae bacterium]
MKNMTTINTTGGIGNNRNRNGIVDVDTVFLMGLVSILMRLVTYCLHPYAGKHARKHLAATPDILRLRERELKRSSSLWSAAICGSWQPMQPLVLQPAFAVR